MSHEALAAALAWQIEAGADEALLDAPVDRRGEAPPPKLTPPRAAPQQAAPPPSDPVEDARAAAADAPDLARLKAALAAFEGSALKGGAKQAVMGDGAPDAEIMVIGEAPGRDEDREGLPFVGRSGRLLDLMLSQIGLSRAPQNGETAVYITNVLPYRPLDNRAPEDAEVVVLLPFLRRQIALVRPKLILCLGNAPAKHLMGAGAGITRFRGTWADITDGETAYPALASFHPAYLLRSPDMKRLAWRDLLTFQERIDRLKTS